MQHFDVAIIGGGPAGRTIVHTLHAGDPGLKVAVFKDEQVNVNRCAVPYGLDGTKPLQKYQISNSLVTDYGAELVVGRVTEVDPEGKRLTLSDGRVFGFDRLVFATGARPLVPPVPGADSARVLPVRSLQDLARLREQAASPVLRQAVVVGGGYIGVEIAVELRRLGFAVTIVEMLPQILAQTTEPEFVTHLSELLTAGGISLRTGVAVRAFGEQKESLEVHLADDSALPCDFAVLAAGVRLNTELAAETGLEVTNFGIVTDDRLRTSRPDIYAAGDCAAKASLVTGQPVRGEFGTNAVFMGRVVGANILGTDARFPGVVNASVTKVFDWGVGAAGVTVDAALKAGLDVAWGISTVPDRYPMIDDVEDIRTKLVFERGSGRLLGGSILRRGDCVAADVDFLSLAIQMGVTREDLLVHQYATHPELAAKPSHNRFVFAARDAKERM